MHTSMDSHRDAWSLSHVYGYPCTPTGMYGTIDVDGKATKSRNRRFGGESDWEISMVPVCVILCALGLWTGISAPASQAAGPCPWVGA